MDTLQVLEMEKYVEDLRLYYCQIVQHQQQQLQLAINCTSNITVDKEIVDNIEEEDKYNEDSEDSEDSDEEQHQDEDNWINSMRAKWLQLIVTDMCKYKPSESKPQLDQFFACIIRANLLQQFLAQVQDICHDVASQIHRLASVVQLLVYKPVHEVEAIFGGPLTLDIIKTQINFLKWMFIWLLHHCYTQQTHLLNNVPENINKTTIQQNH